MMWIRAATVLTAIHNGQRQLTPEPEQPPEMAG